MSVEGAIDDEAGFEGSLLGALLVVARVSGLPLFTPDFVNLRRVSPLSRGGDLGSRGLRLLSSIHEASKDSSASTRGILNSGSGDMVLFRFWRRGVLLLGGDSSEYRELSRLSSSPSTTQDPSISTFFLPGGIFTAKSMSWV